ncbi:MAG: hypothetical protein F4227_05730 [Gammaproteobacteria bacterium]|nr:hypothetical protein [Gammaproteobacteria bacterium]MYF02466.1 hypothetical protein [Gammaproteobacteria bacterium]MYI77885.1 hypothetical protein [Gammaproteobacteria bacterium]
MTAPSGKFTIPMRASRRSSTTAATVMSPNAPITVSARNPMTSRAAKSGTRSEMYAVKFEEGVTISSHEKGTNKLPM